MSVKISVSVLENWVVKNVVNKHDAIAAKFEARTAVYFIKRIANEVKTAIQYIAATVVEVLPSITAVQLHNVSSMEWSMQLVGTINKFP